MPCGCWEMQRHTLLMYTSCGWFFDEISRPEGTQILQYAARGNRTGGRCGRGAARKRLCQAAGSGSQQCHRILSIGRGYLSAVGDPLAGELEQVAAHYAISSLFTAYPREQRLYCYAVHQLDYQIQRLGSLTLAIGQLQLTSELTRETSQLVFAVLHLGGWDFHCCIQPFAGRRSYTSGERQPVCGDSGS